LLSCCLSRHAASSSIKALPRITRRSAFYFENRTIPNG
jgi:hypothetical protein